MFGSAAGAPLRTMASLAAIWILVRIISWNSPGNIAWHPEGADNDTALQDVKAKRQGLARLPLIIPRKDWQEGLATGRYSSFYIAAPRADALPAAERSVSIVPGQSRLLGQDSKAVRSFYLQSSFGRSYGVSSVRTRGTKYFPNRPIVPHNKKMTAYFWIYARQDSRIGHAGRGRTEHSISNGQYGGSQAGAILSYRLVDKPMPEVALYGRLSTALGPISQKEIALGTRIHPLKNLPFALHAEQRFDPSSGSDASTAVYVAGGTGPDRILGKFALETYAQAGYVVGQDETYFFDGSATLQRPIAKLGPSKLSFGPGAWAGGQRGVTRVDVGPRAAFTIPLGTTSARIAVDWRLRVAGDALPGSGAAITISTGF